MWLGHFFSPHNICEVSLAKSYVYTVSIPYTQKYKYIIYFSPRYSENWIASKAAAIPLHSCSHPKQFIICWYLIYCDCEFISCTPSGVELMSKSLFDQTRIRFISRWKCWWWWYLSMWSAWNAFRTLMAWIHHYRTNEIKYTLYFWTIEWVWFKCDFDFKFEQNPIHLCSSTKCTRIQCLYTLVSFLEILKWEIITWKWGPLMANMSFHKKSFS